MISQGGLQEVRVGLTCIRIKQCWEAEFFTCGCGGEQGSSNHPLQAEAHLGVFGQAGLPPQLQLRKQQMNGSSHRDWMVIDFHPSFCGALCDAGHFWSRSSSKYFPVFVLRMPYVDSAADRGKQQKLLKVS